MGSETKRGTSLGRTLLQWGRFHGMGCLQMHLRGGPLLSPGPATCSGGLVSVVGGSSHPAWQAPLGASHLLCSLFSPLQARARNPGLLRAQARDLSSPWPF